MSLPSLTSNTKNIFRFLAALLGDYEMVIADFMGERGSSFDDFAKVARNRQITLLHLCAQGRGKLKDDNYQLLTRVIIDTAKQFWIPKKTVQGIMTAGVKLKRQIGGLYLTYLMYQTQAMKRGTQIMIDAEDLQSIEGFFNSFPPEQKELQDDIQFLVTFMKLDHAFTFCLNSTRYGIDNFSRCHLNITKGQQVEFLEHLQAIRDLTMFCGEGKTMLQRQAEVDSFKTKFVFPMKQNPSYLETSDYEFFTLQKKTKYNETLQHLVNSVKEMEAKPMFTSQNLKASEQLDSVKMSDARKKIVRQYEKAKQKGPKKQTNPYVEDGGIFCRKKDAGEKSANGRKNRAPCTGNLWSYISGDGFGARPAKEARTEVADLSPIEEATDENMID